MTHHEWSTAGDVPPSAWAAMLTDMNPLIATLASAGAQVTGPGGTGAPVADGETLAMRVAVPGHTSVTIAMTRAAGQFTTDTDDALYDALVVSALDRAKRHFGALLVWTSTAGTAARAQAEVIGAGLFGHGDAALAGQTAGAEDPAGAAARICGRAIDAVAAGVGATHAVSATDFLTALLVELTAERDGRMAGEALVAPPADTGSFTPPPA